MRNIIKIFLIISIITASCNKTETTTTSDNYNYFPTDSGRWVKYSVTEINIDEDMNMRDTIKYQLLYTWGGVYSSGQNNKAHILNRFIKTNKQTKWQPINRWYAEITENKIIQTEDNIKYIKILYPLQIGKIWNGNAFNNTDSTNVFEYTITDIDKLENINNTPYNEVLTISQRYFKSEVEKYLYEEKYAKNIGLVEKQQISIYSKHINPNIPIEQRITKGSIFIMRIDSFGK